MENVTICLDFIKNEGIKLMSISANNIVDGDKKLIFGKRFLLSCTPVIFFIITNKSRKKS
jgi:hypothetical protein